MELLVDVLGPVVVIVAAGAVLGRWKSVDAQHLSTLAFWLLGPAFVLDVFGDAEIGSDVLVRLAAAALVAMLASALAGWLLGRTAGFVGDRRAASVMMATYGNVGNAGLAISVFAFGEAASATAALLMVLINGVGMVVGVASGSITSDGLGVALRRALLAPVTVAAFVAVALNLGSVELPLVAERSLGLMSDGLIPMMLVTLGVQLASTGWPSLEADFGVVASSKLLVAPAVAYLAGRWFGLSGMDLGVLTVQSAMPPAVFCVVVSLQYNLEPARVVRTVSAVTLAALMTLPVVLAVVT